MATERSTGTRATHDTPEPGGDGVGGPTRQPTPTPSLRRELLAILFLYAVLSILPLAIGAGCSGL